MQVNTTRQRTSTFTEILTNLNQLSIMDPSNPLNPSLELKEPPSSNPTKTTASSAMSSPDIICQKISPPPRANPAHAPLLPPLDLDPSISFPYQPPPHGLTIRLQPLAPALSALDEMTKARRVNPVAKVKVETEKETAARVLEDHRQSQLPYVQLASRRLQAVLGGKNDWEFEFSNMETPLMHEPPPLKAFDGVNASTGSMFGDSHRSLLRAALTAKAAQNHNPNMGSTAQPKVVHFHPETSKGLKEWLFKCGKENGRTRKSLGSISFHDFSPDVTTGNFSNTLVGHYNNEIPGSKVEVYEMKLPTETADPATGQFSVTMEPWIWFLISRPIISNSWHKDISEGFKDKVIQEPGHIYMHSPGVESNPSLHPPNFPNSIPDPWVVFACPLANVTQYPEVIERPPPKPFTSFPEPPAKRRKTGKYIHKRQDYDFSHQGVPKFEFSNAHIEMFLKEPLYFGYKQGNFLSVDGLPLFDFPPTLRTLQGRQTQYRFNAVDGVLGTRRYQDESGRDLQAPEDFFGIMSREDYILTLQSYKNALQTMTEAEKNQDKVECRRREQEIPCPYYGTWWKMFYEGLCTDEARWRRIKEAMSKGKCRVMIRWQEWDAGEDGEDEPPSIEESAYWWQNGENYNEIPIRSRYSGSFPSSREPSMRKDA